MEQREYTSGLAQIQVHIMSDLPEEVVLRVARNATMATIDGSTIPDGLLVFEQSSSDRAKEIAASLEEIPIPIESEDQREIDEHTVIVSYHDGNRWIVRSFADFQLDIEQETQPEISDDEDSGFRSRATEVT